MKRLENFKKKFHATKDIKGKKLRNEKSKKGPTIKIKTTKQKQHIK